MKQKIFISLLAFFIIIGCLFTFKVNTINAEVTSNNQASSCTIQSLRNCDRDGLIRILIELLLSLIENNQQPGPTPIKPPAPIKPPMPIEVPSKCSDYSEDCVMKTAIDEKDITICEKKYDKAWCMAIFPRLLQEPSYRQNQRCYIQPIDVGYRYGAQSEYDYSYPNIYDNGINDYPDDIAPELAFHHILSIPFNASNAILRVYDSRNNTGLIRLIKYSPLNNSSKLVGDIISKTGGNWGGIYMPIAISKDDSHILFKAQMGSPGAGGGSVTMGYAYLSLASVEYDDCGYLNPKKIADQVYFYDNFSKALFYSEEKNVPSSERPGPYYNSAIKFINIITAETKTLLEEPNTIYEIIDIDEKLGVVNFKSCPWQAYRFSCSDSDKSKSIVLP